MWAVIQGSGNRVVSLDNFITIWYGYGVTKHMSDHAGIVDLVTDL